MPTPRDSRRVEYHTASTPTAGSFDLADHPVPDRARGGVAVHAAEAAARPPRPTPPLDGDGYDVEVELPERRHRRRASPAADARSAAAAASCRPTGSRPGSGRPSPQVFTVDVPAEAELAEPVLVTVTGTRWRGGHRPPRCWSRSAPTPGPPSWSASRAPRPWPTPSRSWSATAPSSPTSPSRTGPTTRCTTAPSTARVGRDASLKHVAVTFGGDVVRHDATATYDGPGGEIEMLGLYFADDGQHIEHRLFVDHNAPADQEPRRSTRARCRARARTRSGSATC